MPDLNPLDDMADAVGDFAGDVVDRGVDIVSTGTDIAGDVVRGGANVVLGVGERALDVAGGLLGGPFGVPSLDPSSIEFVPVTPDRPNRSERAANRSAIRDELRRSSDEVLDEVKDFQEGFDRYIGLYNDFTDSSLSMRDDIVAPFDRLRGIDFARLNEVASKCAEVASDFRAGMRQLNTDVGTHAGGWQGAASNAFLAHMHQFGTTSQVIDTGLDDLADATSDSVSSVQEVIRNYTDALLGIDFEGFDSPDLIDVLIKVSRAEFSAGNLAERLFDGLGELFGIPLPGLPGGGLLGGLLGELVSQFGSVLGTLLDAFGFGSNVSAFVDWVAGLARAYLDATFRHPFDANYELFTSATETAISAVREGFEPVLTAAGAVEAAQFAGLGTPPSDDPHARTQPSLSTDGGTNSGGTGSQEQQTGTGGGAGQGANPPVDQSGSRPAAETPEVPETPETPEVPEGTEITGRPEGLPDGAAWAADPSALPQGWTVDPAIGELFGPNDPAGAGFPEVHSPEGGSALGSGPDELVGEDTEVVVTDDDREITVSGMSGAGGGVDVTVTEGGEVTEYKIRLDEHGQPVLAPTEPDHAPDSPTVTTSTPGAATASAQVADVGTPAPQPTEPVAATGPVMAPHQPIEPVAGPGPIMATEPSAVAGPDATHQATHAGQPTVAATGAASVGEGATGATQHHAANPTGAGMMPLGAGTGSTNEERRHSSTWKIRGDLDIAPTENPVPHRGVIGADKRQGR